MSNVSTYHRTFILIVALNVFYAYGIGGQCLLVGKYDNDVYQMKSAVNIATIFIVYGWLSIVVAVFLTIVSLVLMCCNMNLGIYVVVIRLYDFITVAWIVGMKIILSSYDYNGAHTMFNIIVLFFVTKTVIYI